MQEQSIWYTSLLDLDSVQWHAYKAIKALHVVYKEQVQQRIIRLPSLYNNLKNDTFWFIKGNKWTEFEYVTGGNLWKRMLRNFYFELEKQFESE